MFQVFWDREHIYTQSLSKMKTVSPEGSQAEPDDDEGVLELSRPILVWAWHMLSNVP